MYSIYIEKVWYLYSINILLLVVYIQLINVYVHTVRFLQVWDLFCRKQWYGYLSTLSMFSGLEMYNFVVVDYN